MENSNGKITLSLNSYILTEYPKAEYARICKETLKLFNDGEHRLVFKIITGDETHIPFLCTLQSVKKVNYGSLKKPKATMEKRQRSMNTVMHAVYFRSTALVKAIKLEGQKAVTAN